MKKVLFHPLVLITIFTVALLAGILLGRHTTGSVIVTKESNDDTSQTTTTNVEHPVEDNLLADKININTATVDELCLLPNVGQKTAEKIIDYRNENGPFTRLDELSNIEGFGEKTVNSLKKYLTTGD